MKFREYSPEREVLAKLLKSSKSEFSHVWEKSDESNLTEQEEKTIERIWYDLEWLIARMEGNK